MSASSASDDATAGGAGGVVADDDEEVPPEPQSYYAPLEYDDQHLVPPDASSLPSPFEQKTRVLEAWTTDTLGENELWFLIDHDWWHHWQRFVVFSDQASTLSEGEAPGPINNERLLINMDEIRHDIEKSESDGLYTMVRLKEGLQEKSDYDILPRHVWEVLFSWYGGFFSGGYAPTIARYTITESSYQSYQKKYMLDLFPYFCKVGMLPSSSSSSSTTPSTSSSSLDLDSIEYSDFRFCKSMSLESLMTVVLSHFDISEKEVFDSRLWLTFCRSPWKMFDDGHLQLRVLDEGDFCDSEFVVETKNLIDEFHLDYVSDKFTYGRRGTSGSSYSTGGGYYGGVGRIDYTKNSGDNRATIPGTVGLRNLGNTCFMNSALQCLTKIDCLRVYFTTDQWKKDLNVDNPLGYKGEVASAFAELMTYCWCGKHSVVTPRGFKWIIGKHNTTFQGYRQQDSHELVAFLLDGCHEDLNRIKEKPTTETPQGRGRPNEIVAREAWETYKMRNDSKIVDHFLGQLRSELECPLCHQVSVTFDPYMYLQVPIPGVQTCEIKVKFAYLENRLPPMDLKVEVTKAAQINSLRLAIANLVDIPAKRIAVGELFSRSVYSFYSDRDGLTNIRPNQKVMAWELPETEERVDHLAYHTTEDVVPFGEFALRGKLKSTLVTSKSMYGGTTTYRTYSNDILQYPMVFPVTNDVTTAQELYDHCLRCVVPLLKDGTKELLSDRFGIDLDDPLSCFEQPTREELRAYFVDMKRSRIRLAQDALRKMRDDKARAKRASQYSSSRTGTSSTSSSSSKTMKKSEKTKYDNEKERKAKEDASSSADAEPAAAGDAGDDVEEPTGEDVGTDPEPEPDAAPGDAAPDAVPDAAPDDAAPADDPDTAAADATADDVAEPTGPDGAAAATAAADGAPQEGDGAAAEAEEIARLEAITRESLDLTPEEEAFVAQMPETTDPAAHSLFKLKVLNRAANYHVSAFPRDWAELFYTPHQKVHVGKPRRSIVYSYGGYSAYGAFGSSPRDRKYFRFRIVVPDELSEIFDDDRTAALETHPSALAVKEELGDLSLDDCIRKYSEREILTSENTWYCRVCREHVEASKKIDIWQLPEVLVIQIKRFMSSPFSDRREKIDKPINYPLVLDMAEHVINPACEHRVYDLMGVSVHSGGLGFGHYTALVRAYSNRDLSERSWYDFNDSYVTKVPASRALTPGAYLLVYQVRKPQVEQPTPGGPVEVAAEEPAAEEPAVPEDTDADAADSPADGAPGAAAGGDDPQD